MKRIPCLAALLGLLALSGCTLDEFFGGMVNQIPEAVIDASHSQGTAPLTVQFNAGYSHDDKGIVQYFWDFGDPHDTAPQSELVTTHTYLYPGTYLAGVFNRLSSEVAGRTVVNESIVNVPKWLPVRCRPCNGEWFPPDVSEVLEHDIEVDMHRAVHTRRSRLRDAAGRVLSNTQIQRCYVSQLGCRTKGIDPSQGL